MIKQEMPEIRRNGLVVPGGWIARIPSIKLYESEERVYADYFRSKHGMHEGIACERVREAFIALWVRAWTVTLKEAIADMATKYKRMHPDLGLRGFDPAKAQVGYVPGDVRTGVRGKPAVTELLRRMGTEQRAKDHEVEIVDVIFAVDADNY